jgi:glycopeptide antibiotics resistance protein
MRALVMAWTAVILCAALLPLSDFKDHAHWTRVQWVPFVTPPVSLRDVLLNILLFVPFGYLLSKRPPACGGSVIGVVCLGALLSGLIEFLQIFTHGRFPSATDLVNNVVGAALGVGLARFEVAKTLGSRRPWY